MKLGRNLYVAAVLVAIGCGGSTTSPDTGGSTGDGGDSDGGQTNGDASAGGDGSSQSGDSGGGDSGGSTGTIACGNTMCNATTQDCCLSQQGTSCGAKGSCPGSSLSCTSPQNCSAGDFCCGAIDRDGGFQINATCTTTCSGMGNVRLCSSNADCPMADTCTTFGGGIKFCRRPMDGGVPKDGGPPPPSDAGAG